MGTLGTLLPPWPLLWAFMLASVALAVTPGPGVFYIVARSLAQGRRGGLLSAAGVALGNLGNALAAALGLAALMALSPAAFTAVRLAGAVVLVGLGVQMLRAPAPPVATAAALAAVAPHRLLRDGFVVALLNPKTAIFFAAFLPQFMAPGPLPAAQAVALGALFVAIAALSDSAYALAAGGVSARLAQAHGARRAGRWLGAAVLVGLGIATALAGGGAAAGIRAQTTAMPALAGPDP